MNSYRTQVGIPIKGYFEMVNEYLVDSETRIGGYFKATLGVVYPPKFQRKGSEKVLAFLKDQPNGDLKNAPKELLDPSLYP
ncbi:MAG: hypothetical protein EOP48_16925 [Sphingobacteriales bacterium]|nr:MAG: hypothetical protein EOP48_16925 [Sphingobacteriales bacterium]